MIASPVRFEMEAGKGLLQLLAVVFDKVDRLASHWTEAAAVMELYMVPVALAAESGLSTASRPAHGEATMRHDLADMAKAYVEGCMARERLMCRKQAVAVGSRSRVAEAEADMPAVVAAGPVDRDTGLRKTDSDMRFEPVMGCIDSHKPVEAVDGHMDPVKVLVVDKEQVQVAVYGLSAVPAEVAVGRTAHPRDSSPPTGGTALGLAQQELPTAVGRREPEEVA